MPGQCQNPHETFIRRHTSFRVDRPSLHQGFDVSAKVDGTDSVWRIVCIFGVVGRMRGGGGGGGGGGDGGEGVGVNCLRH